jgi:hypothetical protein
VPRNLILLRRPALCVDLQYLLEVGGVTRGGSDRSRLRQQPIALSRESMLPSTRPTIHSSTRMFSPNPGHRNRPSAPLRNQLTWKIFGRSAPGLSNDSQCAK